MRIFVTGGTGYIGNAVALKLRERGHEVAALVRASADAGSLSDRGVVLITGDLSTLPSIADTLSEYDAYVHTAFSPTADAVALDRTAVDVFTAAGNYLLFTSGVWVLGNSDGRRLDEGSPVNPLAIVAWRPAHEQIVLRSGRNAVLRPGIVYGGRQGICADWFAAADQKRAIEIVGDGRNRWPMVAIDELAELYARAVEEKATGILHGIDDTEATVGECARAVGSRIVNKPVEGAFAEALASNQNVSSEKTRRKLGWNPRKTFPSSLDEQWRDWRA